MKTTCFSIILFTCIGLQAADAAQFYRHIPFNLSIKNTDTIIIDYDFSEKIGVICTSRAPKVEASFSYKGHSKTALLPITLQAYHVPDKSTEALADAKGQFHLVMFATETSLKQYEIRCDYVERE